MTSRVLIIAEHDGTRLNASTAKCVTCAHGIAGAEITIAVCAVDAAAVAAFQDAEGKVQPVPAPK